LAGEGQAPSIEPTLARLLVACPHWHRSQVDKMSPSTFCRQHGRQSRRRHFVDFDASVDETIRVRSSSRFGDQSGRAPHRRMDRFFSGGGRAEPSLLENFFDSVRKNAMLTCKISLPDSPHQVIISKNPGFRALYLARQNQFRFFRLINTKNIFFHFWVLASARKI